MKYILFLENYSILVLNHIYKLQFQWKSPEEVLFLALPTSLPKYTSQLFSILPPGGNLVAFPLCSLLPNPQQFHFAIRIPDGHHHLAVGRNFKMFLLLFVKGRSMKFFPSAYSLQSVSPFCNQMQRLQMSWSWENLHRSLTFL